MITSSQDFRLTGISWRLYLFAARLPAVVNAILLLCLSVLVFVRIGYVYPSRTPVLRGLTIALCVIWGLMILLMMLMLPDVSRLLLLTSLFFPLYYVVLSLVLQRTADAPAREASPLGHAIGLPPQSSSRSSSSPSISATWTLRQAWGVYKLRRGVGDTWFLAADGRRWFRMDERHQDVPLADIPADLQHAFVAVEDHRFFKHLGIDPIALGRAVYRDVRSGGAVAGGSTLTQQLARTLFLSNQKSYGRKIREAALALMIDSALTKAADPRAVSQSHLPERRRLRRRNDVAASVQPARQDTEPRGMRADRRSRPRAIVAVAVDEPRRRDRAQPRRAGAHARGGLHHRGAGARRARDPHPHRALSRTDRSARRLRQGIPAPAVPRRVRRRSSAGLGSAHDVRAGTAGHGRARGGRRAAPLQSARAPGRAGRDRSHKPATSSRSSAGAIFVSRNSIAPFAADGSPDPRSSRSCSRPRSTTAYSPVSVLERSDEHSAAGPDEWAPRNVERTRRRTR